MANTIHNPSQFNPNDYEVLDYFDNKPPEHPIQAFFGMIISDEEYKRLEEIYKAELAVWTDGLTKMFGENFHNVIHKCVHCGNHGHVRYIAAVRHLPSNNIVVFGHQCVERCKFIDQKQFKLRYILDKAGKENAHQRNLLARQKFNENNKNFINTLNNLSNDYLKNGFINDIKSKFYNNFDIPSQNQVSAFLSAVDRQTEWLRKKQEEKAIEDNLPKMVVTEGRIEINGIILGTKVVDKPQYHYGDSCTITKILVRDDRGFKVYGNYFVGCGEKGSKIKFKATVVKSDKDEYFGFFKLPKIIKD